ncbi:MAG: hypothetical protein ACSHX4_11405 [Opitutaceae bacterium]
MVSNSLADLEKQIALYFDTYSAKRVALATLVVGIVSFGLSVGVYALSLNTLVSIGAFFVGSLIAANFAFIFIVPPTNVLKASRELIIDAIKDPRRIKEATPKKVVLLNRRKHARVLSSLELSVWQAIIVPYFMHAQGSGTPVASTEKTPRKMTASERKYVDERRKEILEMEEQLKAERDRLEADQKEHEKNAAELKQAEDLVLERLSQMETAEAEIEQLREDVKYAAPASDESLVKAMKEKEEGLHQKESELESLRQRLEQDRQSVAIREKEMHGHPNSPSEDTMGGKTDSEIHSLEKRIKELEAQSGDLDSRSKYVTEAENSLIERLHELSVREASLEQKEINAGIRED